MTTRIRAFALTAALSITAGACSSPTPPEAEPRTIEGVIDSIMLTGTAPGYSVAVYRGSERVLVKGYGVTNLATGAAVDTLTVFQGGSLMKQFTAAAIFRLEEEGRLALTDPITKHIPEAPAAWSDITLHHLLAHRAGLPDHHPQGEPFREIDLAYVLNRVSSQPRQFPTDAAWSYSNTGYWLLGAVVERLSGQPFHAYIRSAFLTPVGMPRTSYCGKEPSSTPTLGGYSPVGALGNETPPMTMSHPFAAGAICTTAADLVRWQRALTAGSVVSAASYTRMSSVVSQGIGGGASGYGYALMITPSTPGNGFRSIWHNGRIPGFHGTLAYYPDQNLHIAVLSNQFNSDPERLERAITAAVAAFQP